MSTEEPLTRPVITGRSSSHFTRVTRIFAAEMRIDHSFRIVRNLLSSDPAEYGGNPALKVPSLRTERGTWFGALNVCRELSRSSSVGLSTVWPEELDQPLLANAQELAIHAMSTGVALIMAQTTGISENNAHQGKMRQSLLNTMGWLEENAGAALVALPADRDLSYLEVTLFCLVTHLKFREVLPTTPYSALNRFCDAFAERPSARSTEYRFDS